MSRFLTGVTAGLLVAGLCGTFAFAVGDGGSGTLGTTYDYEVGDLGAKAPKISLAFAGAPGAKGDPKAKAKVTGYAGGLLSFQISKATGPGVFDVTVTPKDKSITPVEFVGGVVLVGPDVQSVDRASTPAGGDLVINGQFFGSKKPKVFVGGKKAKVTVVTDTEVTISLNKGTPAGDQDVVLQNKVGEDTLAAAVFVTVPPKPIKGKDAVTGKVGGSKFKNRKGTVVASVLLGTGSDRGLTLAATQIKVVNRLPSSTSMTVLATFPDALANLQLPATVPITSGLLTTLSNGAIINGGSMTLTAIDGARIQGTFNFTSTGQNVTEGKFTATIINPE